MKFTLSWLRDHLDTSASIAEVADAMTMAGLEVEHVDDPGAKLAAFTVARIVEARQHPNADRLRVCQVDTVDGRKEIVCGAPNARTGLTTIYAPIGAYIPGSGITLEPRPVRGVVSNGMLCSAAELEVAEESDGILELPDDLSVGAPAAEVFGAEPVIDFEVTPNRPDWLGVNGIARDLAAAGLGRFTDRVPAPVPGAYPCPIEIRITAPELCPMFAGRVIRGVRNGPSPAWLQARLKAVGLKPISALVDVTQYLSFDRARPLHVYDVAKLSGHVVVARGGHPGEHLIALDGKTYVPDADTCVIADGDHSSPASAGEGDHEVVEGAGRAPSSDAHQDGARPIGLGGVMGGASTGCSDETTDIFLESAWFDPGATAATGRKLGIVSDAQYRFARGVDPAFVLPGLELATAMILELCGGEPSEVAVAGAPPPPPPAFDFDPAYVRALSGLSIDRARTVDILTALGFDLQGSDTLRVQPPSWRRDIEGKADLVEEVARIEGYAALPSTPLPTVEPRPGGVLTALQARARTARRALAAAGFQEAVTWSFTARDKARLFGGGEDERLIVANPIAADLDCMRPSTLPNLIEAAGRNAARGFPDAALFEIGPIYGDDSESGQWLAATAVLAAHPPRRWDGAVEQPLFALKGDLWALLEELGAPMFSLRTVQGEASPWWHPGRSAGVRLGPRTTLAEFGELHPRVLKALDVTGPIHGFELILNALPEARRKGGKTRPSLQASPLMPLTRDFAFVVDRTRPAGELKAALQGADKALIRAVEIFDVYEGAGVPEGSKSVALEVTIQPRDKTLTDAEIEALSVRIVAAAAKLGAVLRS